MLCCAGNSCYGITRTRSSSESLVRSNRNYGYRRLLYVCVCVWNSSEWEADDDELIYHRTFRRKRVMCVRYSHPVVTSAVLCRRVGVPLILSTQWHKDKALSSAGYVDGWPVPLNQWVSCYYKEPPVSPLFCFVSFRPNGKFRIYKKKKKKKKKKKLACY